MYENIRFRKPNLTVVNGYFWMVDEDSDSVVVKTDDGSVAYSYPLDTTLTGTIRSLEYDGYNIWTLEQNGTTGVKIRRWCIRNYVCTLRNEFSLTESSTHKYSSEAMAVEHYHTVFTASEDGGQTILSIQDGSKMSSGYTLVLGPNSLGQIEEVTVNMAAADSVAINGTTKYAYGVGDPISFYKKIWLFNNYNGVDGTTGALYEIDPYTGSYIHKTAAGAYKDIKATTFFGVPKYVFEKGTSNVDPRFNSICYVKGTNLLFLNPDDLDNSFGSMTMDNIEADQATIIPIYDMAIEGTNIYRSQRKATYYGKTETFADSTYNYQLSTLNSFITSISMHADPAILPANGVNNSTITIIVKDQFNLPVPQKPVYVTDDDPDGGVLNQWPSTDENGVALTIYRAGFTAREVRITATAQQS